MSAVPPLPRRAVQRVTTVVRPTWTVLATDPVREGRLRLGGLEPAVRQMSVAGLVVLIGVLGSLLVNDLWRRGDLVLVRDFTGAPLAFLPTALLPFTLICMGVAWVLILWGGALATPRTAMAVVIGYLLVNASIGEAPALTVSSHDALGLRLGPDLVRVGYFLAPAAALLGAFVRRLRVPVLVVVVAGCGLMFGGQLWVHAAEQSEGKPLFLPSLMSGAVLGVQNILVPVFLVSLIALVEAAYRVAEAAAQPAWDVSPLGAKLLVALLIVVKLRFELWHRLGEWTTYARERASAAGQAVAALVFFAVLAWLLRGLRRRARDEEGTTEGIVYVGSILLTTPLLIAFVALGVAQFLIVQLNGPAAGRWVQENFPFSFVSEYSQLIAYSLAFLAGLLLYFRSTGRPARAELGAVLILLGAWSVPNLIAQHVLDRAVGFQADFADLLLTLAAAVYLIVRWPGLDTKRTVNLGALIGFTWLVAGKGDVFARVTSLLTLPGALVLVFGIVYTLLTDSSFASGDSRQFPRPSRPLVWIGYLILSATLTNFLLTTHADDFTAGFQNLGYHFLAVPLAAWLVIRRRFAPPEQAMDAEPAEAAGGLADG